MWLNNVNNWEPKDILLKCLKFKRYKVELKYLYIQIDKVTGMIFFKNLFFLCKLIFLPANIVNKVSFVPTYTNIYT